MMAIQVYRMRRSPGSVRGSSGIFRPGSHENAAHRTAVEWDEAGHVQDGVYVREAGRSPERWHCAADAEGGSDRNSDRDRHRCPDRSVLRLGPGHRLPHPVARGHRFEGRDGKTVMTDEVAFRSPLGPLGWLVDRLFMAGYLRRLPEGLCQGIKQ
jgi:hypothetical protein